MQLSTFVQLLVNILVVASQYALMATGFALIYRVSKVFHFAHGITFILGAYFLFLSGSFETSSFIMVAICAVIACGIFGSMIEMLIYRHLRNKSISHVGFLIASLGIYIALQNIISLSFGDETQSIAFSGFRSVIEFYGIRLTIGQAGGFIVAVTCLTILSIIQKKTRLGKEWRACAQDWELAEVVGINVKRAIFICFFVGSCFAGLSGICVGLDVDINPTRGMFALIIAFVVYIISGEASIVGIFAASSLISCAQTFGGWLFGTQWQNAIVFVALIVFLFVRPEGFMGKRIRKATV